MADKLVSMGTERDHNLGGHAHVLFDYYLWDSGWLVMFNRESKQWSKLRVPHAEEIGDERPDLEAAPEVSVDD